MYVHGHVHGLTRAYERIHERCDFRAVSEAAHGPRKIGAVGRSL